MQEAELVLGNCASFSFILGTIITILGLVSAEPLLRLFGASDKTLPFALDYIYVLLSVNTFNTLQFAMSSVMRGVGHPTCCLLYTSDAADEEDSVDLGGRRII